MNAQNYSFTETILFDLRPGKGESLPAAGRGGLSPELAKGRTSIQNQAIESDILSSVGDFM